MEELEILSNSNPTSRNSYNQFTRFLESSFVPVGSSYSDIHFTQVCGPPQEIIPLTSPNPDSHSQEHHFYQLEIRSRAT